jgi:DNA-binding MarR family transcriptional regulator
VANKVDVFNKLKEIHHRIGTSVPQILVSQVARELALSQEELSRHLEGLAAMDLVKVQRHYPWCRRA